MQCGQSCCFHQLANVLSFSCISVWSAPPPARWGSLVLNAAPWPRRSTLGSTTCPALGGGLPQLSAFAAFPMFVHWEFGSLPHPVLQGGFSVAPPPPLSVLEFTIYVFQFCWGGFSLPRGCAGFCSQGMGREVSHGVLCSPVHSANSHASRFWASSSGVKWCQLFPVHHGVGRLSMY
jgi:hypothetical protein